MVVSGQHRMYIADDGCPGTEASDPDGYSER